MLNLKIYTKKSYCAYKTLGYSSYVSLHRVVILMYDFILRNTTEWLFPNLYYGQHESAPLMM